MTSLEKEETDAAAIDVFSDGESADSADTQAAKSVTASGAVADNVTWTLYEDGELAISGTGLICLLIIVKHLYHGIVIRGR